MVNWVSREKWNKGYKHPLWFKKQKEIVQRDGGRCTVCGSTEHLQVHHTYYYNEYTPPWGYPDECYLTLCKEHHQWWHENFEIVYKDKPKPPKKKRKNKNSTPPPPWRVKKKAKSLAGKVSEKEREKERKKKYKFANGKWWKI